MENVKSCSLAELENMEQETYQLLDIRSMEAFDHGHLKDALNIPANELIERKDELQTEKKIIVYCQSGVISTDQAELLSGFGFDACSLEGGYDKWLLNHFQETARNADIEKSIRKKFHKSIFSKFTKAINEYQLVREGDKIAVCISGGKDSMLMAKLFQELQRHHKFPFEVVYLVMDPGYNERNRQIIEQNAKILNIPLTIFETNIFEAVYNIEKSPCYLCARMRRGHLYSKAKELGCGALCFEGNIDFYGKSGFRQASEFGIRYHGLPEGEDASFFLCEELMPGYLNGITGEYAPPAGYLVNEKEAETFDREFPYMEKKKLPGQIF